LLGQGWAFVEGVAAVGCLAGEQVEVAGERGWVVAGGAPEKGAAPQWQPGVVGCYSLPGQGVAGCQPPLVLWVACWQPTREQPAAGCRPPSGQMVAGCQPSRPLSAASGASELQFWGHVSRAVPHEYAFESGGPNPTRLAISSDTDATPVHTPARHGTAVLHGHQFSMAIPRCPKAQHALTGTFGPRLRRPGKCPAGIMITQTFEPEPR